MPRRNCNARGGRKSSRKKPKPKSKAGDLNLSKDQLNPSDDPDYLPKRESVWGNIIKRESEEHDQQLKIGFEKVYAGSWRDDPEKVRLVDDLRQQSYRNSIQREQERSGK